MVRVRVTEFALQRITTFRMRGMRATHEVGGELARLARLAADPDLSLEHRVKIGVQKGTVSTHGVVWHILIYVVLGWQLLYERKFEAAKKLMSEILPIATTNMMTHQSDQAMQVRKHATDRVQL